jgi:hypothetical protein
MAEEQIYLDRGREYYKATGNLVWPSRHREHPSLKPGDQEHLGALKDCSYVRMLLERLDKLERETRPSGKGQTAAEKDLNAFQALRTAGKLVEYVAGWAIDHQIGLAMEGKGFVPLATAQAKAHPEYIEGRAAVDDHRHEKSGGLALKIDAAAQRAALINLLVANSGGLPDSVQQPAIEALEALNFEEVLPILAPVKGNRKVKLVELRLQLKVVGFVEFQIATGVKKHKALKTAGGVMNLAESTISGWEYRLRGELGELAVVRALTRYSNWGRSFQINKERWAAGDKEADPETYEELGGLPALIVTAKKYRQWKNNNASG